MSSAAASAAAAAAARGSARGFDDVEDALLEIIFSHACACGPAFRHNAAIARVCRRWHQVYTQSTVLWQDVAVDWGACQARGGWPACCAAARWLERRLPYCRRLVLRGAPGPVPPFSALFPSGLSSQRLQEVRFTEAGRAVGEAGLALLHGCPALHTLALACHQQATGTVDALAVRGEALRGLSTLHALRSLELTLDKLDGSTAGLAPALSSLTRLSLRCRLESAALAPDFPEGLSQLRRLELGCLRLAQFTPRLAQALSQLTHLACTDVLAARPRRRAGITLWEGLRRLASLRELRLEHQAGGGMPANALACAGLQGLTLLAAAADDWPAADLLRYTGEGGCLRGLASLHLEALKLTHPVPGALWRALAPSLTALTWRDNRVPDAFEEVAVQAAALQVQAEPPDVHLFQAVAVPHELSALQALRELRLEYAQLDAVPPALQALTRLTLLSLEGNRISALPEGQYLTGLQSLNLACNACAELPEGLTACSSLRQLSLCDNPLHISRAAAEKLAAALSQHLQQLSVSAAVALAPSGGAPAEAHCEGLKRLAELLGNRLVLQ